MQDKPLQPVYPRSNRAPGRRHFAAATTRDMILDIAEDYGADMLVNSCSFCPARVETRPHEIIAEFGGNFELPVVYYRQLISVACGRSTGDTVPDGQIVKA